MKQLYSISLLCLMSVVLIASCNSRQATKMPIPVIFDTDLGPDYDDVGALAMLHALADSGEVEILATIASNTYENTVPCIEIINTYFGRPDIPVGAPLKGVDIVDPRFEFDEDHWPVVLAAKYPHKTAKTADAPDAVLVYRKALSSAPDTSVHIITVGFFTNLANLLESEPDSISKLNGLELVTKKVKRMISMGGDFPNGKEYNYNFFVDSVAAYNVFKKWPTPITFSGFKIGYEIVTGKRLIAMDIDNSPIKDAFSIAMKADTAGRYSWDQTAVLTGVRGYNPYFDVVKGTITVYPDASNTWENNPNSIHEYLIFKMPKDELTKVIEDLMMHQPMKE